MVTDWVNNSIRHVTMTGAVSIVTGNGEEGFTDGESAAAHFNGTQDLVVDGEDVIVVTDCDNHRLRKIVGGQVTTLTGSSEPDTADGAGVVARFNESSGLTLDERGRLLVAESAGGEGRKDTLRVVEASLVPMMWMDPVEEAVKDSETVMSTKIQTKVAELYKLYVCVHLKSPYSAFLKRYLFMSPPRIRLVRETTCFRQSRSCFSP